MKFYYAAAAAACLFVSVSATAVSAEEPKTPAPAAPAADMYKLPDNPTSKSLLEFCKRIEAYEPKSQAEADDLRSKAGPAMKKACEQIIAFEKGDQTPDGHYAKRIVLFLELSEQLTATRDPAAPGVQKASEALQKFLLDPKFTVEDVQMAEQLGELLESTDPKKAGDFYTSLAKMYEKSDNPAIVGSGKAMAGAARRLLLVGNSMELKGTKLDGKPFDIAELKGKVVLVDFWATWCHYCVEEIPNVKQNYAGYHDKGFEVVAISADQDRAALDAFVAKNKITWVNLHDAGGRNPALEFYAIKGFPTTFLVDKDGKVVTLEARGEELTRQLKKLLGDPIPQKELPKADAPTADPLKDAIKEAIKEGK